MASRDGTTGQGAIDIFDTRNGELVHTVCLKRNCVSCMAYSDRAQYSGTLEGYCFSFSRDIEMVRSSAKPRYVYVSQDALDGIVVTAGGLWVCHTCYIFFLHLDTLAFEGSIAHPLCWDCWPTQAVCRWIHCVECPHGWGIRVCVECGPTVPPV